MAQRLTRFLPFVLGALVAVSSSAFAQWGPSPPPTLAPCLPYWPTNVIDWAGQPPSVGQASGFGRVIVGDWDADLSLDSAVVAGTRGSYMQEPDAWNSPFPIITPGGPLENPADMATILKGGVGRRDAIAATSPAGLEVYFLDGTQWNRNLVDTGLWVNAAPIHVDDLDNDGRLDIYGVSGTSIIWVYGQPSGWSSTNSIGLANTPADVLAIDWNGNGSTEFAMNSSAGLLVKDMSGGLVELRSFSGSYAGAIARIQLPLPVQADYIVWARDSATTKPELVIARSGVTKNVGDLEMDLCGGPVVEVIPTSLHVGDWDESGELDLIVAQDKDKVSVVLKNVGAPLYFDPDDVSDYEVLPLVSTTGGTLNAGIPAFAQVDGQGPDDVIYPLRDEEEVVVFTTVQGVHNAITTLWSGDIVRHESEYEPVQGQLNFAFEVPTQYRNRHWIEVTQWWEAGPYNFPIADAKTQIIPLKVNAQGKANKYQYVPLYPPQAGSYWNPQRYLWTEYRFVTLDFPNPHETSQFVVVGGSARFFGGMTLLTSEPVSPSVIATPSPCNGCLYQHIMDQGGDDDVVIVLEADGGVTPPTESNGDHFGAYVPCSQAPPFDPSMPLPDAPPPTLVEWSAFVFTPSS